MSWTKECIKTLLEHYSNHKVLYDRNDRNYHNKAARTVALQNIQYELMKTRPETTVPDIIKKYNGLRTNYIVERKKLVKSIESGETGDDVYMPSLFYFYDMAFLNDYITCKVPTKSTTDQLAFDTTEVKEEDADSYEKNINVDLSTPEEKERAISDASSLSCNVADRSTDTGSQDSQNISSSTKKLRRTDDNMSSVSNTPSTGRNDEGDDIWGSYILSLVKQLRNKKLKARLKHHIINLVQTEIENECMEDD